MNQIEPALVGHPKIDLVLNELLILNNALNEVCNGLDEFEFEVRMGASAEEVSELLKKIRHVIDNIEGTSGL